MNYELAKELKDAGFRQSGRAGGTYIYEDQSTFPDYDALQHTNQLPLVARVPTLDELIEACGEDFSVLDRIEANNWEAHRINAVVFSGKGSTPTEAVAKLWLALNTKV